jgi:flagellar basal body rod protein FlgC
MAELLDNLYNQENYLISKKLLDATHLRHEALANNLANVETPASSAGICPRLLPLNFVVQ